MAAQDRKRLTVQDYHVAWICAVRDLELLPARLMLDANHHAPSYDTEHNEYTYLFGEINRHNVVLATLLGSKTGNVNASHLASQLFWTFPKIRIALLVGIGGGIPLHPPHADPLQDIHLGDVVVGCPLAGNPPSIYYEYGRSKPGGREILNKGRMEDPDRRALSGLDTLTSDYEFDPEEVQARFSEQLQRLRRNKTHGHKFQLPPPDSDKLFKADNYHQGDWGDCNGCYSLELVKRPPRRNEDRETLVFHRGMIAIGNQIIQNGEERDRIRELCDGLPRCVEMEAAGVEVNRKCLIIRGISDYADSHKNDDWRQCAAGHAAAFARQLLYTIPAGDLQAKESETASLRHTHVEYAQSSNHCPKYLAEVDSHEVKTRIEETKGGLLKDASSWILHHADFQQWRDRDSQLLWIKGDPGKGKTMLLCTIIDELDGKTKLRDPEATTLLSYFFCQATDASLNNATAVLRGLIYMLVKQCDSLLPHLRDKFDNSGEPRFQDATAWNVLSAILANILRDGKLPKTDLIIDALDECTIGRDQLVDLVHRNASSRVRWIVSSRNDVEPQEELNCPHSILGLEQLNNAEAVSQAVHTYINSKTAHIKSPKTDPLLQDHVREILRQKADGTFLWVALAVQELKRARPWKVRDVVDKVPRGLDDLYDRMVQKVQRLDGSEPEYCRLVLSAATLAYRPLRLRELGSVSGLPDEISCETEWIQQIVTMSGSFLSVRGETVYFVHQSARDYLIGKAAWSIFPAGLAAAHHAMFRQSLNAKRKVLRRDIYNLRCPGISIDNVKMPDLDPLAAVRYSCAYWIDHFCDAHNGIPTVYQSHLLDGSDIHDFLQQYFLYWVEALSLCGAISDGVLAVARLERLLKTITTDSELLLLMQDAYRFLRSNGFIIKAAPLQAYASALLFSPTKSICRQLFREEEPKWVTIQPTPCTHWSPLVQTLTGHTDSVDAVAFSPDGQLVASASFDGTVKLWHAGTGEEKQTLAGHTDWVFAVTFSPDGQLVASASGDCTVKLWHVGTGEEKQTLAGHTGMVTDVTFSPDGQLVASASQDRTVKLWHVGTGEEKQTLAGHTDVVFAVAFSPDGQLVASASQDRTVKLWHAGTGEKIQTLSGQCPVYTITFDVSMKFLLTNTGRISLGSAAPATAQNSKIANVAPAAGAATQQRLEQQLKQKTYGVSDDGSWIAYDGERVLWLPHEFNRPLLVAWGSAIAIGCMSGRVLIFRFSDVNPPL